jgi:hypothetical protein
MGEARPGVMERTITASAFGKKVREFANNKCAGDDGQIMYSGVRNHRTNSFRGWIVDKEITLAFIKKRFGVRDDAVYLEELENA